MIPCVQQTISDDSAESNISYNFFVNDDPDVLNPFGERSSSSSPIDDVLESPVCETLRVVGITLKFARCFTV